MSMSFQKVEPVTKKGRVVETVREAIVSGAIKPGEQLVEGRIARQFGVGQGLIREALIELEHQGFVERIPFSGTQVSEFSLEDTEQIFDLRIELEPMAFALAGRRASAEEIEGLEALLEEMRRSVEADAVNAFLEQNLAYRRKVWKLSGNKYLARTLERLVAPLFALYIMRQPFNEESKQRMAEGVGEQEAVVRALRAGDAEGAGRMVREYLVKTRDQLQQLLT